MVEYPKTADGDSIKCAEKTPVIRLWDVSMDNKYLWLDLSMLFNCDAGLDDVATCLQNGEIVCCFNWKFPDDDKKYFERIVRIPYEKWWGELWNEGCARNTQIMLKRRKQNGTL